MADKVHKKTQDLVWDIKSGLHGIHGAGEALRGGAMEALDGIFHKHEGEERNKEIAERGLAEIREGEAGVEGKRQHNAVAGQGSHLATANASVTVPAQPSAGVGPGSRDGLREAKLANPNHLDHSTGPGSGVRFA
ncbi:hypothetical protein EDD36DRAFT_195074 [Exophiala viscosa]|uniref:Uncharacterized protein n=1 Tax=Exophiala viscosa TaxID=2486360 RepID=A0AAN6E1U6_9EURO|nr:hypothetical protein EDD36DRAFT_195074 [Exophiala viscosa]